MSLGYIQAGFEVVAAVDNDPDAIITYMVNLCRYGDFKIHFVEPSDFERLESKMENYYRSCGVKIKNSVIDIEPNKKVIPAIPTAGNGWIKHQPLSVPGVSHIFFGDARKLTGERILNAIGVDWGELGCVMGGPPCQGFSRANTRRNIMDPRNSLVFEFARLILEMHPKTMIMENVPGILDMHTPDGIPVVDAFCHLLENGHWGTINALKRSIEKKSGVGFIKNRKKNEGKETEIGSDNQLKLF